MLFDVVDHILHGPHLLCIIVRNLDVKRLFDGHYKLNGIQRIGTEVIDEGRSRRNFDLFHAELSSFSDAAAADKANV